MDLSKLLNGFFMVVLYISCTLPNKTKIWKLFEWVKILRPFGSVAPLIMFWILYIWSFYFTLPSMPILPPFLPYGIGYDLHAMIHSRRVNQRKYFQINCSLEALISSYFHHFNSMAVCNWVVCALFWNSQRKNWYFSNRRNIPHLPKHLLQRRVSLCAICDLVNAEPLKATKVGTVSKNFQK